MKLEEPGFVRPLGVFGVLAGQHEMDKLANKLRALSNGIAGPERSRIANYMRTGTIVLAIMEYTRDVLDNKFGVSGGSAIHTDGVYYWRRDAADYVETYGSELPVDFLERAQDHKWLSPQLTRAQVLSIDEYLSQHIRRFSSPPIAI